MQTILSKSLRESNYNSFDRLEKIGTGQFGKVYKCVDKNTRKSFAMKKITVNKEIEESVEREVTNLAALEPSPRLVQFFGSKRCGNSLLIFLELVPQGNLAEYIKRSGRLNESETAFFTRQVLEGIDFLHNRLIIHRDIKSGNILLDEDFNVKLADFGLTKKVEQLTELENQTFVGTTKYMAPELLTNHIYNSKVDIWSLGVTVVEMITGKTIYPELSHPQFILHMARNNPITYELPANTSRELDYYLRLSFTYLPMSRPDTTDMMKTKFILNVTAHHDRSLRTCPF